MMKKMILVSLDLNENIFIVESLNKIDNLCYNVLTGIKNKE